MRKVGGIIFMTLAGFVFSMVTLFAFFGGLSPLGKLFIMLMFAVAAAVPHGIGVALADPKQWKRYTGIVLLSVAGYTALAALIFACMYFSEEVRKLFPPDSTIIFGSIPTGLTVLAASAALGWMLLQSDRAGAGLE